MFKDILARTPRHFHVYKGSLLVLILEDRPGTLHSRAAPGPGGAPQHPFVHAIARDAVSEDELGRLLRQSDSFDQYLERLVASGYDVASAGDAENTERPGGLRIVDTAGAAGVLWPQSGQFTTLDQQPERGRLVFPAVTLTVYHPEVADSLLALLNTATDFEALCRAIEDKGFQLTALAG